MIGQPTAAELAHTERLIRLMWYLKGQPDYARGLAYGKPRRGHQEGTVASHIAELTQNLMLLIESGYVTGADERLFFELAIHFHDTWKCVARPHAAILDSDSHGALAQAALWEMWRAVGGGEHPQITTLGHLLRFHDLGFALWRRHVNGRPMNDRIDVIQRYFPDPRLYLTFCMIDGCTPSKGRDILRWFFREVAARSAYRAEVERLGHAIDLFPPGLLEGAGQAGVAPQ